MDHQARNKISAINPNDWEKLGYSDSTIANDETEGLTNEIDPIFHFDHPSHKTPIWLGINKSQYEDLLVDIKPMLQLASLLIRSSPSLNADYDLYYSPRVHPEERVSFGGRPVLEYRHVETTEAYEPRRRDLADAALDRLAGVVSFGIGEPDSERVLAQTLVSLARHPSGVNIQDDTDLPKGIGSTICFSKVLIADLRRLRNEEGVDNKLKLSNLTFKGAAMLCHELFHAKYMATDTPSLTDALVETSARNYASLRKSGRQGDVARNNEPLHENDSDAELGHVWEKYVFGGHIQNDGNVDSCVFFNKWPSYWATTNNLRRGGWRKRMTTYVVPMHYILNLTRQKFWDDMDVMEDMTEEDLTVLHIKKWIGFRINCPYPQVEDQAWNSEDSSEAEYPPESPYSPRVCREREGEVLQDPSWARANESREDRLDRQRDRQLNRQFLEQAQGMQWS